MITTLIHHKRFILLALAAAALVAWGATTAFSGSKEARPLPGISPSSGQPALGVKGFVSYVVRDAMEMSRNRAGTTIPSTLIH